MIPLIYTLVVTHLTMVATTIYLHRGKAHRSLEYHPALEHFFRFWLWLTDGVDVQQWVAQHRLHHAKSDQVGDPHSPVIFGIKRIAIDGFFTTCINRYGSKPFVSDIDLAVYGKGCPDDWMERNVYRPHLRQGLVLMLIINVLLFGRLGLLIWLVQLTWSPMISNSIITGLAHWGLGYKHPKSGDNSHNLPGLGFLVIGDQLHSNHHANPAAAKLSQRWFEFDLGWVYIKIFEALGLLKINKIQ